MKILDWIENMREKPEGQRKRTALFLALGCMAVVVFFWLVVEIIPEKFSDGNLEKGNAVSEKGPVSVLGDMIGETIGKIKGVKIWNK